MDYVPYAVLYIPGSLVTASLYFLIPLPFLPVPHLPWQPSSVLCICECVSVLFVCLACSLDSIYKWNHIRFVCPTSPGIIPSRPTHVFSNSKILFFFFWPSHISLCKCTTALLSMHLLMDTGLLPYLGDCKYAVVRTGAHVRPVQKKSSHC